jgi:hypothetical protein
MVGYLLRIGNRLGAASGNGCHLNLIQYGRRSYGRRSTDEADHVIDHLCRMVDENLSSFDVKPDAMERYNIDTQKGIETVKVWQASCNGYYRSANGRVVTQWPYTMGEYRRRCEAVDWADFHTSRAHQEGRRQREGAA